MDLVSKRCQHEGLADVKHKKCEYPGCKTVRSYGVPGGQPQFCAKHKAEGMVHLMGKLCEHEGCTKHACYGEAGLGENARFCVEHKLEGMVDVKNKLCEESGCSTLPSHAFPGKKARLYISWRGWWTSRTNSVRSRAATYASSG